MSSIDDIMRAVEGLSLSDLTVFRAWFAQRDAADWDQQFEADVAAGRLDALGKQVLEDLREVRCSKISQTDPAE